VTSEVRFFSHVPLFMVLTPFLPSTSSCPLILEHEIAVLQLHLKPHQYYWFLVPSLLLILLLALSPFLLPTHAGYIDLADPVSAALLALSSPEDTTVNAFDGGKEQGNVRICLGMVGLGRRGSSGKERLVLVRVREDLDDEVDTVRLGTETKSA
jgi:hypothetical protein